MRQIRLALYRDANVAPNGRCLLLPALTAQGYGSTARAPGEQELA
jgi:hypothetical protein